MEKTSKSTINKIFNSKILPWLLCCFAFLYIFIQRSCNNPKIITKNKETIKYDTIYKPQEIKTEVVTKYKTIQGKDFIIPGKVDTIIIKEFEKAPDSTKIKMFADCKTIRQYNQIFNDSLADVSVFAETEGRLLKIVPSVTIKARLPEKKTVFALYGGFELSNNLQFNNPIIKGNIFFQNKKGDLYTTGYDTNKNIYLGYSFRFINIKK